VNKITCPACAGPAEQRKYCSTCNGKMEVTQEVFDAFMVEKQKQEDAIAFWDKVQEYLYQTGKFKFEAGEEVFELDN
jgi:predicted amidophosphoribosyltransferase